jgi:ubiquinone/menaquinone biosynthesis C-methylase UbiE
MGGVEVSQCELKWTGERLVTTVQGDVVLEHLHRYALAAELARDKVVLDFACGEGYGSDALARVARRVIGVDIDPTSICHATRTYRRQNLEFRAGSATRIPVESASVDLVVSFETIEHLAEHDLMLGEIKRVLVPGGTLIISTPDRTNYSEIPSYNNPYHVKELNLEEFVALIGHSFRSYAVLGQRVCEGSLQSPVAGSGFETSGFRSYEGDFKEIHAEEGLRAPTYLVAIATDHELPPIRAMSLFEGAGILSNNALQLRERDQRLQQAGHEIVRLEQDVAETRQVLAQREADLAETRQMLAQREAHIAEICRQLEQSEQKAIEREVQLSLATREQNQAAVEIAELRRILAEQDRRLACARDQMIRVEASLAGALGSRSWRITAPLRAAGRLTRRFLSQAEHKLGKKVQLAQGQGD